MHETSFAEVACPARWVVLNLPLLDYSIGHRLLVLRQRNPLLWLPEADFNALPFEQQIQWLIEAVFVCSMTYRARLRLEKPSFLGWRLALNWWRNKRWHRANRKRSQNLESRIQNPDDGDATSDYWSLEIANFRNYINSQTVVTEWKQRREGFPFLPCLPAEDAKGRSLGGPYDAALIQFLLKSGLCRTEAECLEYPFGAAQIHYLAHLEREGALKIINSSEMEFEEYNQQADLQAARAAGFATVDEHVAHVLEQSKVQSPKSKVTPAGLATDIPDDLRPPYSDSQILSPDS